MKVWAGVGLAMALGSAGEAASPPIYLDHVESPVFETAGDVQTIAREANVCAAKILKPGIVNASTIITADVDGGVIVARNAFEYSETVWGSPTVQPARTTVTIEARPGRFRLTHSDIQVFMFGEWRPIRAAKPGKRDEMREQLSAITSRVSDCVTAAKADW